MSPKALKSHLFPFILVYGFITSTNTEQFYKWGARSIKNIVFVAIFEALFFITIMFSRYLILEEDAKY